MTTKDVDTDQASRVDWVQETPMTPPSDLLALVRQWRDEAKDNYILHPGYELALKNCAHELEAALLRIEAEPQLDPECPVCGVKQSEAADVAREINEEHVPTPEREAEGRAAMKRLAHTLLERAAAPSRCETFLPLPHGAGQWTPNVCATCGRVAEEHPTAPLSEAQTPQPDTAEQQEIALLRRALGEESDELREEVTRRREAFRSVLIRAEKAEARVKELEAAAPLRPAEGRLRELARHEAGRRHYDWMQAFDHHGHSGSTDTCPHPDCQLVRATSAVRQEPK